MAPIIIYISGQYQPDDGRIVLVAIGEGGRWAVPQPVTSKEEADAALKTFTQMYRDIGADVRPG